MEIKFDEPTRRILDGKNFATVATVNPDGGPQASVVWFQRDGDTVIFSTTSDKQKARNLQRDPRIALAVFDLENPYHSVEIRGTAELTEDAGKDLPKQLSHRYLNEDPPAEPGEASAWWPASFPRGSIASPRSARPGVGGLAPGCRFLAD
jgi:PPOX class probable F420-dependent enzyme